MKKKTVYFINGIHPLFEIKKLTKVNKNYLIVLEDKIFLKFISQFNFKKNKIKILNSNPLLKNFELMILIIYFKMRKYEIKFFHNAYWPFFDFLINLFYVNCTQYLLTYEDWSSNHKVNKKVSNIFKIKNLSILKKIRIFILIKTIYRNHELFYRKSFIKNKDDLIIYTNYKFHEGITSNLVYRDQIIKSRKKNIFKIFKKKNKKKILLLPTKKYPEKFKITKKLFHYVVKILIKTNHKIYFKDHPTHSSGLDFKKFSKVKKINIIKNTKLIENLKLRFDIVIGFGSTGMVYYNERAISLVKFYGKSSYLDQKKYFDLNGAPLINYPKNYAQIKKLLKP